MKPAVIYARVSSDKQKEEHTIASQTEALRGFALQQGFSVPDEWVIEDEGYSGATLVRPGLERVRDLASEGQIDAVLVYSPDRLSRKYAYQVLLIGEFARHSVQTVFIKAPQTATAEDQLLLQFQGMIAEYERAQILERSRRGKRHRALQGVVNVLCGAPYGYRYIRKTEHAPASYAIIDAEATVVRKVYEYYTVAGSSIGAITRPTRLRGGFASRDSAHHERPREDWIEIPVPPIVTEETFALASERLQANKDHAPRRTITPSVVQGLVSCRKCSYGLYPTSTRTSARMIYYYRCLGSDAWRGLGGPVCDSKPIRQDLLDEVVWREILKLLESPHLIQEELERRLAAARNASPVKRREEHLQQELARIRKSMERLMTAYQEELMSLDDLRRRMPELRKREQAISAELNAIESQLADRAGYLRLAETVTSFLARLRETAKTLDVAERQRIVRLLVKEILVDDDTIVIRHSIPAPTESTDGSGPTSRSRGRQPPGDASYLLRKGRSEPTACQHLYESVPEALAADDERGSVPCGRCRVGPRVCATTARRGDEHVTTNSSSLAAQEMRAGLSNSDYRIRVQTTESCFVPMDEVVSVSEKAGQDLVR